MQVETTSRDRLIQLVRRIDWRFLLPSPALGRIAYAGKRDEQHIAALQQFCEQLDRIDSVAQQPRQPDYSTGKYDILVINNLSLPEFEPLLPLLKPTGCLYWQIERTFPEILSFTKINRLRHPVRLAAKLHKLGFQDAAVHWHRPGFADCKEIIPLPDKTAIKFALNKGHTGLKGLLKQIGSQALYFSGLLPNVISSFSILARRSEAGNEGNTLTAFLKQNPQLGASQYSGSPDDMSIVYLTPGFQASSHIIAFALKKGQKQPALVVKFPRIPGDHSRLEREAANLSQIAETPPPMHGIPQLLAYQDRHGHQMLAQSMVPGKLLRPAMARTNHEKALFTGSQWLFDFHCLTKKPAAEIPEWFEKVIGQPLVTLSNQFILTPQEQIAIEKTATFAEMLRDRLPFLVFEHGDFSAPNLLLDKDALGVVDWELGDPHGLPLADYTFFLTFLTFAKANAKYLHQYLGAFEEAFYKSGWAKAYMYHFAGNADLPAQLVSPLFVTGWARYLANMITRLRGDSPRLSDETVAWLRQNRYYHIWLMASEKGLEL